jgi:hypothetical protein
MGNYSGHPRICCPAMLLGSTRQILLFLWLARGGMTDRFYGNSRVTNLASWLPVLVMVCE